MITIPVLIHMDTSFHLNSVPLKQGMITVHLKQEIGHPGLPVYSSQSPLFLYTTKERNMYHNDYDNKQTLPNTCSYFKQDRASKYMKKNGCTTKITTDKG